MSLIHEICDSFALFPRRILNLFQLHPVASICIYFECSYWPDLWNLIGDSYLQSLPGIMSILYLSLYLHLVSRFSFQASSWAYADTLPWLLFPVSSGALIYNLFRGSHLQPLPRLIPKPLPGLFIPASSGALLFQASSGALISSPFWGSRFLPLLWLILNIFHGSSFEPLPGLSFPASSGALVSSLFRGSHFQHLPGSISCCFWG